MRAMLLDAAQQPLRPVDLPRPKPTTGQVLIAVHTCAICRTDLHVVDGELPRPKRPLVPGHQIVGTIQGPLAQLVGLLQAPQRELVYVLAQRGKDAEQASPPA